MLNCYSYHLSPAGSMFETGLHHLGCAVIPGGVGHTELQARAIADLEPSGYVGTPVPVDPEKCDELGLASSTLKRALGFREAFLPLVRRDFLKARDRGIPGPAGHRTDLGMVAYETEAREGLVLNEDTILEIVRPGTGDPVAEGEVGEVVVTTPNAGLPAVGLVATGDLSALLPGPSPCGRTNVRIKGWMGRADQTTKVRGMFVHPHQVAERRWRHGLQSARPPVVDNEGGQDRMTLRIEGAADAPAVEASLRDAEGARRGAQCAAREPAQRRQGDRRPPEPL